jgi:predicted RNase H-like nuclease (RuvC/YqgF family)
LAISNLAIRTLNVELSKQVKRSSNRVRTIVRTITRPDGTVEKSKEKIENKTKEFSEIKDKTASSETKSERISSRKETEVATKTKRLSTFSLTLTTRSVTSVSNLENYSFDVGLRLGPLPLEGVVGYDLGSSFFGGDFRFGLRLNF